MSVDIRAVKEALGSLGGDCCGYDAMLTAWNDQLRGVGADTGSLSCYGPNITDARLSAQDGRPIPYVRPQNMDEQLGIIRARNVYFRREDGTSTSVQDILDDPMSVCSYMGVEKLNFKPTRDMKLILRIQTGWIPLKKDETSVKYAVSHFSYQTKDETPRNFLITGTNQGIFCHADKVGDNVLYAHTVDARGTIQKHWFEAAPSTTKVGAKAQTAFPRFGIDGAEQTNNQYMVLSIPNKVKRELGDGSSFAQSDAPVYRSLGTSFQADVSIAKESEGVEEARTLSIERPEDEYPVLTIVLFNTVQAEEDTVSIAPADLANAVRTMENMYGLCDNVCKLSQLPALLRKWTEEDQKALQEHIKKQRAIDPFEPRVDAMETVLKS